MIITLKKADFSSKNIGTLSTWSITKKLTGVTTTDTTTSVEKGNGYSAVFVVMEGYEFISTSSVTNVTIGGIQNNSCISISPDNTSIEVNISAGELTGNVVITIMVDSIQPEEPQSNFVLLDDSILVTSDDNIFNVQEEE